MGMKGYKVFNSDWTCRGFQYKVGETYEMDEEPIICKRGFHFCQNLKDCFYYYTLNKDVKIAEVEALGDVKTEPFTPTTKHCTNKIKIIREIPFEDLEVETETKEKEVISDEYYDLGIINIGNGKPILIDYDIVLYGILHVLKRTYRNFDPYRAYLPICYMKKYTYLVTYTTITDIKEVSHEL